MKNTRLLSVPGAAVFAVLTLPVHAALVPVLGGLAVYDDVRDISWVANANLAASNTFGLPYNTDLGDYPGDIFGPDYEEEIAPDGRMTWGAALHWIDAMNADGGTGYLGTNGWYLPSSLNSDGSGPCGPEYNCSDSEMGDLFYNGFGGTAESWNTSNYNANYDLFSNVQSDLQSESYWSSTEYAPSTLSAWHFYLSGGYQDHARKYSLRHALAVHPGNVGAVPIPAAVWLFGSGLLGLVGLGRQKNRGQARLI